MYNRLKESQRLLAEHQDSEASLTIHLYPEFFRIGQVVNRSEPAPVPQLPPSFKMNFAIDSATFAYDSPMRCLLTAVREQKVPVELVDVFDESGVRYFENCLIVEIHDHRESAPPKASKPAFDLVLSFQETDAFYSGSHVPGPAERYRTVLFPTDASRYNDLALIERPALLDQAHKTWSLHDALDVEAVLVNSTSPPLCLEPDLRVSRAANVLLRDAFVPSMTPIEDKFRPLSAEEAQRRSRIRDERYETKRLLSVANEGIGRIPGRRAFSRFDFVKSYREKKGGPAPGQLAEAGSALSATSLAEKGSAKKNKTDSAKKKRKSDSGAKSSKKKQRFSEYSMSPSPSISSPADVSSRKKIKLVKR